MRDQKINIIGGGISGMITAMTLQSLGIDYSLFEKNSELSYEEVGIGLSANVFAILETLNIVDEVKSNGTFIEKMHLLNMKAKCLKTFSLKKPALSLNRNTFYKIISNKLDKEKIQLNHLAQAENFKDNEIVIDSSGMNSKIRKELYPEIQLRDSKQYLWRGISNINLPKKYQNAYHDFIGNNLRFAIIHTGLNFYSWYLITESSQNEYQKDNSREDVQNLIKNCPEEIRNIVSNSNDIFFSKLFDINPRTRKKRLWYDKNTVLIGDAIHPTTPNMANGACLSIEDGFLLGNLLSEDKPISKTYEKFQLERERKINLVVHQSWFFGTLMHWNSSTMTYLVEKAIQLSPQLLFNKIYSAILNEGELLPRMYRQY